MNVIAKDYGFVEMKLSDSFFGIGGSRKFRNLGYGVPKVAHLIERTPRRKLFDSPILVERPDDEGHSRRTYRMNVGYFKRKAIAYSLLRRSTQFLAFYTVSFPAGLPDKAI